MLRHFLPAVALSMCVLYVIETKKKEGYGIISVKRDLTHVISRFQIF